MDSSVNTTTVSVAGGADTSADPSFQSLLSTTTTGAPGDGGDGLTDRDHLFTDSSLHENNYPFLAFDGDYSTCSSTGVSDYPYFEVRLQNQVRLKKFRLYPGYRNKTQEELDNHIQVNDLQINGTDPELETDPTSEAFAFYVEHLVNLTREPKEGVYVRNSLKGAGGFGPIYRAMLLINPGEQ